MSATESQEANIILARLKGNEMVKPSFTRRYVLSENTPYIKWSLQWIKEASRVLNDTGTLYICGFSEILADLKR